MPVIYAVNRNIVGNPVLASNVSVPIYSNSTVNFVLTDATGNVYIGGNYQSNNFAGGIVYLPNASTAGPNGASTANVFSSATSTYAMTNQATGAMNAYGGYVAKYSPAGNPLWCLPIVSVGGTSNVTVNCGAFDVNSSNLYIGIGYYSAALTLNLANTFATAGTNQTTGITLITLPSTTGLGAITQPTGALIKISPTGASLWASVINSVGSSTASFSNVVAVGVDPNNNPYISVQYYATTVNTPILNGNPGASPVNTTVLLPTTIGSTTQEIGIVKYSPIGVAQWSQNIASALAAEIEISATSIGIDSTSNIYIAGSASGAAGSIVAYPNATNIGGSGSNITYVTTAFTSGYIMKYSTAGAFLWGTFVGSNVYINQITVSPYNSVYLCGNIYTPTTTSTVFYGATTNGSVGFIPSAPTSLVTPITINTAVNAAGIGFVAKYSPTGTPQWYSTLASNVLSTYTAIAVDSSDANLYVAGKYQAGGTYISNVVNGNGLVSVTLPPAPIVSACIVRLFLGNGLASSGTVLNTSSNASTNISTLSLDPTMTNLYMGGYYAQYAAQVALTSTNATGTGSSTVYLPPTQAGLGQLNLNGFWAKYT